VDSWTGRAVEALGEYRLALLEVGQASLERLHPRSYSTRQVSQKAALTYGQVC
jgi:hypothetical protein